MEIKKNYSLKEYNTFGVNVKAQYFAEVLSENEIDELLHREEFRNVKKIILGGGSNILFTRDVDGLVIKISTKGINVIEENDETVLVEASAGEQWDDLVSFCVQNKYYGIENLTLIPGTVGAAPIQNIGAYGVELHDVFVSLDGIMLESGERKMFDKEKCRFGYRDSIFKSKLREKFLITKVVLKLSKQKHLNLNYRAFHKYIKKNDIAKFTIENVRDLVKKIRMSKLPNPKEFGNAGSFFKNPEVSGEQCYSLQKRFPDLVNFKLDNDKYKISAGWLIEKCGLKGKREGNVGIHKLQALVIVNYGDASGSEILSFAENVQSTVRKKFDIELIPEVNIY